MISSDTSIVSKKRIVDALYKNIQNNSVFEIDNIINCLIQEIGDNLMRGNIIDIDDFGKFVTIKQKERCGKNSRTGQNMYIERTVVKFISAKCLHDKINDK